MLRSPKAETEVTVGRARERSLNNTLPESRKAYSVRLRFESGCAGYGIGYVCRRNGHDHFIHNADKQTYRRVMAVGLMFCALFVSISSSLRRQPDNSHVLLKADRFVRTAGEPRRAD